MRCLYWEGNQTLENVAQSCVRVSILGDTENLKDTALTNLL